MKITKNKYLRLALLFVAAGLSMLVIFALTQGLNIRNINTPEYKSSVSYPTAPFTLSLWLPSEEKGNLEEVVADYQKIHPSAKVNIEYIDPALYQANTGIKNQVSEEYGAVLIWRTLHIPPHFHLTTHFQAHPQCLPSSSSVAAVGNPHALYHV